PKVSNHHLTTPQCNQKSNKQQPEAYNGRNHYKSRVDKKIKRPEKSEPGQVGPTTSDPKPPPTQSNTAKQEPPAPPPSRRPRKSTKLCKKCEKKPTPAQADNSSKHYATTH